MADVCLQVCVLCGEADSGDPQAVPAGRHLYEALLQAGADTLEIEILPVDCLAVCDRPVTLAFQAPGKWCYLVGGVDPACDVDDILAAAKAVADSPQGIPAMDDRPTFFRKGVIARVPPQPKD